MLASGYYQPGTLGVIYDRQCWLGDVGYPIAILIDLISKFVRTQVTDDVTTGSSCSLDFISFISEKVMGL